MSRTTSIVARLAIVAVALAVAVGGGTGASGAEPLRQQASSGFFDVVLVVGPAPTTRLGTPVTLELSVALATGPAVDFGEVTFHDGSTEIATVDVDAQGRATTTFTPVGAGVHRLWARWMGNDPFGSFAESAIHEHTVIDLMTVPPRVVLSVAPRDRSPAGTPVDLTAVVEGELWARDFAGAQVVFLDRGVPVGADEVVLDGDMYVAGVEVTLPPGVHELSALFLGTADAPRTASPTVVHSALPATCPEHAWPGNGALVRLAYRTVLGRCPDAAGFTYWTERLARGASPAVLGRGLALSAEGIAATVDAAYRRVLDRPADPAGRAVWAAKLRAGWTTSQLWAALAASPEFVAGAPGGLVDRAFDRLVGRPVDEPSRPYWEQRLAAVPRSGALRALALTTEALDRVVDAASEDVRGYPAPTSEGHVAAIKARRGDWRLLVADLLAHPAALRHAQTYPDPAT